MRSQSALEFLSTYSWAFLIITIFLASMYLIAFAPTGPSTYVPSSCYITPTLPCYQSVLLANSSGSKFITLFQNNMGVGIHFPANSIYVHPSFSSNAVYVGSCLPRTAPPGATVVCNVTLAAFKPSIGSQVNPTFTLSYQICPSCNTTAALVYNTSGTSTVTASSSASALYEVQLVTSPSTGNIVISGVRYPSGANVIFIAGVDYPIYAISPSGYAFGGWILSNVIVGNAMQQYTTATGGINSDPAACIQACSYPFVTSTSTTTIPVYTLTMNAGTGGYVTPSSGSYPSGNTVSITATPLTGYAFSSWTGTGSGSYSGASSSASVTMNGDVTETASFAPQGYSFSATMGSGGTVACSGDGTSCSASYAYGTQETVTASPSSNYAFSSWSCNPTSACSTLISSPTTVTIPALSTTVTANFVQTLCNNVHTPAQCTSAEGTIVGDGSGNNMCQFAASACLSGWTEYGSWTSTASNLSSAPSITCGPSVIGIPCTGTCSSGVQSGSHSWSNTGVETACEWASVEGDNYACGTPRCLSYNYYGTPSGACTYFNGPILGELEACATATITQIGCC